MQWAKYLSTNGRKVTFPTSIIFLPGTVLEQAAERLDINLPVSRAWVKLASSRGDVAKIQHPA